MDGKILRNGLKFVLNLCADVIEIACKVISMPFRSTAELLDESSEKKVKEKAVGKLAVSLLLIAVGVVKWELLMMILIAVSLIKQVLIKMKNNKIKGVIEYV